MTPQSLDLLALDIPVCEKVSPLNATPLIVASVVQTYDSIA